MKPSDLHAPHIYNIMIRFIAEELAQQPTVTKKQWAKKFNIEYPERKPVPAVVNTRNPFSRLFAAWADKFNYNSAFFDWHLGWQKPNSKKKWIFNTVQALEQNEFKKQAGYSNSFEAFLKYISISSTETHNHHWRSLFWLCRPCQLKYEYITRIENAEVESNFVFNALNFNTYLPNDHGSSMLKNTWMKGKTTQKPTTAERYKSVPIKTIIDIYRKYYLDFVVFGFSADSVLEIINHPSLERLDFNDQGNEEAIKYMKFGTDLERAELIRKSISRKLKHHRTFFGLPLEQYENCDNIILQ